MVTLAKGSEVTGRDSTGLEALCGWLLESRLILFQSSQFILWNIKKQLVRIILNVFQLLQISSVIS